MSRESRRKFKRFVELWLRRNVKPLEVDEVLDFEQWIKNTPYTESRKIQLREVYEKCGHAPSLKDLKTAKCFIKDECYPEFKFPRGIYSRSDAAKCHFGPLVASISSKIFDLKWFIKTVPVNDRPMAIYNELYAPGAQYIFTDYTSFEAHFRKEIMDCCENVLFKYMCTKTPSVWPVLNQMFEAKTGLNKLVFKTFNACLEACRLSGEMDTSLSNGFTNLMCFLYVCFLKGINPDKIRGFVEGDDGIFRIPFGHSMPTAEDFYLLGFTIKIGITDKLERASFCGQIYDVEDLAVVTDIREQVCRLGWTNKRYVGANESTLKQLLRARGFSLVYQYGRCPILGTLGRKILELTHGVTIRQSIIDSHNQYEKAELLEALSGYDKLPSCVVGLQTRILVEQEYCISISEQLDIEAKINKMDCIGPLPFQFQEIPKVWTDYYETYSVSDAKNVPVWIPSSDSPTVANFSRLGLRLERNCEQQLARAGEMAER